MATYPIRSAVTTTVWTIMGQMGDALQGDDTIIVPESTKMEIPVITPRADQVNTPLVAEGNALDEGQQVSVFEEASAL